MVSFTQAQCGIAKLDVAIISFALAQGNYDFDGKVTLFICKILSIFICAIQLFMIYLKLVSLLPPRPAGIFHL